MAKLYFRYGAMGSAKTLNLLAVAHNYQQQGKKILLIKPALEDRFGQNTIASRAGLEAQADLLLKAGDTIHESQLKNVSCLLVDEVQFLNKELIEQLRFISTNYDIPVICYGLRTDFSGHLFEGSKRLFELADTLEEIKTTCTKCNRKATMNLRLCNGKATLEGPSVMLGAEETYIPVCFACYQQQLDSATEKKFSAAPTPTFESL